MIRPNPTSNGVAIDASVDGRATMKSIVDVGATDQGPSTADGPGKPAHGLFLSQVFYYELNCLPSRQAKARVLVRTVSCGG